MNKKYWNTKYDMLIKNGQVGSMSLYINDRIVDFFFNLSDILKEFQGDIIIDFGCGSAKNLIFLTDFFNSKKYIGYDIAKNIIDYCKSMKLRNAKFKVFDNDIEPADIIWSSFVLQHIKDSEFLDILTLFKSKLLAQGSILIVNSVIEGVNNENMYYRDIKEHEALFKKSELKSKLLTTIDVGGTECGLWELKE